MCAPGSKAHHAVIDMLRKWFVLAAAIAVAFLSWMHQLIAYQVVILLENFIFSQTSNEASLHTTEVSLLTGQFLSILF